MDSLAQDVRLALRAIWRRPLFAVVATASIAIGVGANTAVFSVFNALVLRQPPGLGEPERVVEIGRTNRGGGFDTFSYPELVDLQTQVPQFAQVAGWRTEPMSFSSGERAERVMGVAVSHTYFDALGTAPQRGRFFAASEDVAPRGAHVTVVSHAFWRDRLGGDSNAVGSTILLNRTPFTVIGIARPEFQGHMPVLPPDVYIPLSTMSVMRPGSDSFEARWASWLMIVGRLAPNATLEQANASLNTLFSRLASEYPDQYGGDNQRSARAQTITQLPGGGRAILLGFMSLLLGMVGLILLTTCANVAGMLLARGAAREREVAVRMALGSSRARLVRQLLVESLMLFLLGGIGGVLLGFWAASVLQAIPLPSPVPISLDFAPDARVLGVGLGLALVTGIGFGLAPALQATRPGLMSVIRTVGGMRSSRTRQLFVTAQVGLALLLLVSAGLFLRSLQRAAAIDAGFDPAGVQMTMFDLGIDGYEEQNGQQFLRTLLANLEGAAGVAAAGVTQDLPLDLGVTEFGVYPEGWTGEERFGFGTAFSTVSPGYFEALSIPLLRGRTFQWSDDEQAEGVAIVTPSFAAAAWPNEDPIGRRLRLSADGDEWLTVVGVASEVKNKMLMDQPEPMLYLPVTQQYRGALTLVVRTTRPEVQAMALVREQIKRADPQLSHSPVQPLAGYTGIGLLPQRIAALLTSALGALALLLCALGVYGVIAYTVSQRTREIGVRMAVGASTARVAREVLGGAFRLALPGLLVGAAGAAGLAQLMRTFILGVPPLDPITFLLMPALLAVTIALAGWIPARRAAAVEPLEALRNE